jgi:protein-tyrosine phosphatase
LQKGVIVEIKIFGRTDLENFVQKNPKQYDVVYYTHSESPSIDLVKNNALESLHMPVDDIDHYGYVQHVAPTAQLVQKFLAFGKNRKKLIVACAAGVSRSSSTAYLIAAQEFGPEKALTYLTGAHHWPNRLNVYIGTILLKEPKIWEKYVEWSRHWNGHDPSQGWRWPTSELISKMGFDKV